MLRCSFKFTLLFLVLMAPAYGQNGRKEKLEQQKIRLMDEIELANSILAETQKSKEVSLSTFTAVQQKLKLRSSLINTLDRELKIMDAEIEELNRDIDTLESEIVKLKEDYAQMIRQAYKSKNKYSRLMFLLSSGSFNQMMLRLEYMKQYSEFRRRQVEEIDAKKADLDAKKEELKRQRLRKEAIKGQMQLEQSKLEEEKARQEQTITSLQKQEKEIEKELKTKQEQANNLEKEIQRIIAAEIKKAKLRAIRKRIEDEAKRVGLVKGKDFTNRTNNDVLKSLIEKKKKERAAANNPVAESTAPSYDLTPDDKLLASNFVANKSRLPWPVERGLVISSFGPHRHPIATNVWVNNNGVDIATERGSNVRSAFDGEVSGIIRTPTGQVGVIVAHGNYFTVYLNLEEVHVKDGDKIKSKQSIGKVRTDPKEGKTVLHFEVWKNTQVLDPAPWLAKKVIKQ